MASMLELSSRAPSKQKQRMSLAGLNDEERREGIWVEPNNLVW